MARYEVVRAVDGPDGTTLHPGAVFDAGDWKGAQALIDDGSIREADADAAPGGVKTQPEQVDTGETAEDKAADAMTGAPADPPLPAVGGDGKPDADAKATHKDAKKATKKE